MLEPTLAPGYILCADLLVTNRLSERIGVGRVIERDDFAGGGGLKPADRPAALEGWIVEYPAVELAPGQPLRRREWPGDLVVVGVKLALDEQDRRP